jgi:DNA-binding CsgD family transcriptional regulator
MEEGLMTTTQRLRPVERRVLRLVDEGLDDAEIGRRFGRSERWTAQVRFLADLDVPRSHHADGDGDDGEGDGELGDVGDAEDVGGHERLRPLERRILRWRAQGVDHDELADRFGHSADFLARVEGYAHYKLAAAS